MHLLNKGNTQLQKRFGHSARQYLAAPVNPHPTCFTIIQSLLPLSAESDLILHKMKKLWKEKMAAADTLLCVGEYGNNYCDYIFFFLPYFQVQLSV